MALRICRRAGCIGRECELSRIKSPYFLNFFVEGNQCNPVDVDLIETLRHLELSLATDL
jgi:hypothetical protein